LYADVPFGPWVPRNFRRPLVVNEPTPAALEDLATGRQRLVMRGPARPLARLDVDIQPSD